MSYVISSFSWARWKKRHIVVDMGLCGETTIFRRWTTMGACYHVVSCRLYKHDGLPGEKQNFIPKVGSEIINKSKTKWLSHWQRLLQLTLLSTHMYRHESQLVWLIEHNCRSSWLFVFVMGRRVCNFLKEKRERKQWSSLALGEIKMIASWLPFKDFWVPSPSQELSKAREAIRPQLISLLHRVKWFKSWG